eukprot:scaffold136990_cov31-Tisochrysis_lutea.AAC.1
MPTLAHVMVLMAAYTDTTPKRELLFGQVPPTPGDDPLEDLSGQPPTAGDCPPCVVLTGGNQAGSTACAPCAIARTWKQLNGGSYAEGCANAMAIALGEGVYPPQPLKYITDYGGTWAGPKSPTDNTASGPPISKAEFITQTSVFDLNQPAYDQQITLGPWQTLTAELHVTDPQYRAKEAIGYVQSCCASNVVSPDIDVPIAGKCSKAADCPNEENGQCPVNPNNNDYPISTIFKSPLEPPLTWCGCMLGHSATTGYSGRCSQNMEDFYTQYMELAQAICDF